MNSPAEFQALARRAGDGDEAARAALLELARTAAGESAHPDYHGRAGPKTFVHADLTPIGVDHRGELLCRTCGLEKTYWYAGRYFCRPCRNAASRRYTAKRRKPVVAPTHCRRGHPLEIVYLSGGPRCAQCVKARYQRRKANPENALYQRRWQRQKRARAG